jgi:hypothetical protein
VRHVVVHETTDPEAAVIEYEVEGVRDAQTERRRNEALEQQQIREEAARDRTQRRELRVEHRKWRRDRRQDAYQGLLDAAHEAQGTIWQLGRLPLEPFDQHRYDIRRGTAIDAVRAWVLTHATKKAVVALGPT